MVAPVAPPVNVNVFPAQIGLGLADAVTAVGAAGDTTTVLLTQVVVLHVPSART